MAQRRSSKFQAQTAFHRNSSSGIGKNYLSNVPFFKGRDADFLEKLTEYLELEVFIAGTNIITVGEAGDKMYFLTRGEVEVLVGVDQLKVATLGSGSVFGEGALVSAQKRTATVRALEFCDCRSVNRHAFQNLLKRFPAEQRHFTQLHEERNSENQKEIKNSVERSNSMQIDQPENRTSSFRSEGQGKRRIARREYLGRTDEDDPTLDSEASRRCFSPHFIREGEDSRSEASSDFGESDEELADLKDSVLLFSHPLEIAPSEPDKEKSSGRLSDGRDGRESHKERESYGLLSNRDRESHGRLSFDSAVSSGSIEAREAQSQETGGEVGLGKQSSGEVLTRSLERVSPRRNNGRLNRFSLFEFSSLQDLQYGKTTSLSSIDSSGQDTIKSPRKPRARKSLFDIVLKAEESSALEFGFGQSLGEGPLLDSVDSEDQPCVHKQDSPVKQGFLPALPTRPALERSESTISTNSGKDVATVSPRSIGSSIEASFYSCAETRRSNGSRKSFVKVNWNQDAFQQRLMACHEEKEMASPEQPRLEGTIRARQPQRSAYSSETEKYKRQFDLDLDLLSKLKMDNAALRAQVGNLRQQTSNMPTTMATGGYFAPNVFTSFPNIARTSVNSSPRQRKLFSACVQ